MGKYDFIRDGREKYHKNEYNSARDFMGNRDTTPEWEDLTDIQRENIRVENRRYQQEMNDFGKMISKNHLKT